MATNHGHRETHSRPPMPDKSLKPLLIAAGVVLLLLLSLAAYAAVLLLQPEPPKLRPKPAQPAATASGLGFAETPREPGTPKPQFVRRNAPNAPAGIGSGRKPASPTSGYCVAGLGDENLASFKACLAEHGVLPPPPPSADPQS